MNEHRIKKTEKYLIGGIENISEFISKELGYRNKELIKKQFIKQDLIKLKKFNDFDSLAIPNILSQISLNLSIPHTNVWQEFNYVPFTTYFDSDLQTCCINFINQLTLEDSHKEEIIRFIENYKIELYATELLRDVFADKDSQEMYEIFFYMSDITIDLDVRLVTLNKHINLINKAIIKNDEILKHRIKKHLRLSACIINTFLEGLLKKINNELGEYVTLLNTSFNNILDKRKAKADILSYLFENQMKLDKFLSYENILFQHRYVDIENGTWLKSPILFVKFYQYCENKNLFKMSFDGKTKGIVKFRELYSFQEGKTLDKPSKRKKLKNINTDYWMLNN